MILIYSRWLIKNSHQQSQETYWYITVYTAYYQEKDIIIFVVKMMNVMATF